ncbi:JAB domain-containing protein [Exiguobacterium sp. s57]|uniref:JAB domain-containing protein n=1 Tax=Exiguobacterium sp. s57 TaxID=2751258 RepID=UPI001BED0AD7|nr:JAB domain-containing protein [Exiguobacterium sp. s57]
MKPNQPAKRVDIVSIKLVKEGGVRYKGRTIHRPDDGYTLMKEFLEGIDREHFLVVSLDTKNQPVSVNVCHIGSLNASIVHPREVLKVAILSNAAAAMIGYNHPSGNTESSRVNLEVTKRLREACELMDIHLREHLIINDETYRAL